MAKRLTRVWDEDAGTITYTDVATGKFLVVNPRKDYSELTQLRLMLFADNNKLGDKIAGAAEGVDLIAEITVVHETLVADQWTQRGAGTGAVRSTILFDAACRLYPDQDQDAVRTKIDSLSKEEKTDLGKHPDIAAFMDEIKKERQNAKAKKSKAAAATAKADSALTF